MSEAAHELAMAPARRGTIVNVTVSPHHGMPAMAHTGAARAAVEALTRELAGAWATDGVSVVAVAVGRFATESLRKSQPRCGVVPPRAYRCSSLASSTNTPG